MTLMLLLISVGASANNTVSVTFYHYDGIGSPIAATDETGNVVWQERREPFGAPKLHQANKQTHPVDYTGHVYDKELGLIYMGRRFYDPKIGRFISVDPVGFTPSNVQSFNRYAYANNNPYKYWDPDGQYADLVVEGISITLGVHSFMSNFSQGNYGLAAIDGLGVIGDGALALIPGLPGGIGLGIQSVRQGSKHGIDVLNNVSAGGGNDVIEVFRAFGGDARAQGFAWTTKDPRTISNFRDSAGLPSGGASGATNTANFLIKGNVKSSDIIKSRAALPLDGNKGGLPELIIDPKNVNITDFSVLKP